MDNFYDYIREQSSMSGCNTNKWDCEKYLDCDICLQDKIAEHEKRIRADAINEISRERNNFYKWHYLDKDPNDIPKHNGWYIICTGTEWTNGKVTHKGTKNYDSEIRISEFFDGKWKMGMVIAWCEKPIHPYLDKGEQNNE